MNSKKKIREFVFLKNQRLDKKGGTEGNFKKVCYKENKE